MRRVRLIGMILRQTGADSIIISFLIFMLLCAVVMWLFDPGIGSLGEGIWYCFTVVSTIGFGDVVVQLAFSKALSMLLSIYAVVILAIFTGVIVNYFNQLVELRQKESLAAIAHKLERLPELSKDELAELSREVRRILGKL